MSVVHGHSYGPYTAEDLRVHVLDNGVYRLGRTVTEGNALTVAEPLPVSFDPAVLAPWRRGQE